MKSINGKTTVKFSLNIGVGNDVDDTFTVEEIVPDWKGLKQGAIKEKIQYEFEEWKNERIDGAWEVVP